MTMLDPDSGQKDLRGGTSPWRTEQAIRRSTTLTDSIRCEVLVVGAGITGAMIAEHLTSLGRDVVVIDREPSGFGSTAASTSMLMWEIDRSLSELTDLYGFERAASIYRRSFAAVADFRSLMATLDVTAAVRTRHSLYLASEDSPAHALLQECELRRKAGLPSEFLDRGALKREFDIDGDGAIVSDGSADADPLRLSHALMRRAVGRGARLIGAEASDYQAGGRSVAVGLDNSITIEAGHVVLATGYVMPDFVTSDLHRVASTWALATTQQAPGALWRDGALIWESAKNYAYARTTEDNRIVIGGEDEPDMTGQQDRDRLMSEKTLKLADKLRKLWPCADVVAEYAWSGAFSTTRDGLPLIGPVPGYPRICAAYGYGGNGITFSFLASRMIGEAIAGRPRNWFEDFALDRPAP